MSAILAPEPRSLPEAAASKALFRLSASRGRLALELGESFGIGPLRLTQLISWLEGLSFPVDLSGGVERFRHRRGSLQSLVVETQLSRLADYLTPKAKEALDSPGLRLALIPAPTGLVVGVDDDDRALAFSALFAPHDEQLRFVIHAARSIGFGSHAQAIALRLAQALGGPRAVVEGSLITIDQAIARLIREVLIDAGARLPSTSGLHLDWDMTEDGIRLTASTSINEKAPDSHVLRAIELAKIARSGDEALTNDDLIGAREAYLRAFEAAPRHPDLALRLAELDLVAGHAPESALASVVETMPAVDGGIVGAELLFALGERNAAVVALRRAAAMECFAPLAARILALAARFSSESFEAIALLDEALAACPSCSSIRWQRARSRLESGHFTDAVADLGHLEAAARGSRARFEVCLEAGHLLMKGRLPLDARVFFEKALRYSPRDPRASAGLARAFFDIGDGKRGIALLSRATTLMHDTASPTPSLVIELALALAEHAQDFSSAIYHVRSIPFGIAETIAARALEGRWRNMIDDRVGASHAYSQAREAASLLPLPTVANHIDWLIEAARFELEVNKDPRTAKRHAELALHASPDSGLAKQWFRKAAREEQGLMDDEATSQSRKRQEPTEHVPDTGLVQQVLSPEPTLGFVESMETSAEDEQAIESLTDRIRANPKDEPAVRKLCSILERAGRHLDLMALVSGQIEETTNEPLRLELLATRIRVLEALIVECRAEGRDEEGQMYELVLAHDLETRE